MPHASHDNTGDIMLNGSIITYTCDTGYWFPNKTYDQSAVCGGDGNLTFNGWPSDWTRECVGELAGPGYFVLHIIFICLFSLILITITKVHGYRVFTNYFCDRNAR